MKAYKEYFTEGVSALLPIYEEGAGDSTLFVNRDGHKRIIHKKLKTVIKRLVSHYSYDLASLHQKYGELISQKYKIPLPLHPNLILVPFKIREPRIKGDFTYGYINYKCINKYVKNNKYSKIILNNGVEIPLLQSYYTTHRNILNAALVTKEFILQHYTPQEAKDSHNNNDNLNSPTTHEEIALLNYRISRLLKLLESILKN